MTDLFEIREQPLDVAEVMAAVSASDAGAVAVFVGTVRDHNDGRPVTRLEYQAYRSMAEKQMRSIAVGISEEIPGVRLAVLHRVGSLDVGDAAVVCAASSPHRDEAFRACRLLIDRIKADVPIWKREHGPDGPYWVGWEDARCTPGHSTGSGHVHEARHSREAGHSHETEHAHQPGRSPGAPSSPESDRHKAGRPTG